MVGRVVSAKNNRTATVLIERVSTHPVYKKPFKRSKKYLAHDEIGAKEGDLVEIEKIRPVSKHKHWQIVKVVGKSLEEIIGEQLKVEAKEAIAEVMPEEKEKEESSVVSPQTEEEIKKQRRPRKKKGESES